jgi:hypothetical protein
MSRATRIRRAAATRISPTHIIPPASPNSLGGDNGSINLTTATANGVNNPRIGSFVYVSPESYFFASPTVVYVTDSGQPKKPGAGPVAEFADRAEVATKPGVARHYGRSSCSARMLPD